MKIGDRLIDKGQEYEVARNSGFEYSCTNCDFSHNNCCNRDFEHNGSCMVSHTQTFKKVNKPKDENES